MTPALRLAEQLAALTEEQRTALLKATPPETFEQLNYTWKLWAREDQLPPEGDWRIWLLLAGRGAGKTRSACEWLRGEIEAGRVRCAAIAAPTNLAARKVLIEGESGLLAICPPWARPTYEMAVGKLSWPNGAVAHLMTAEVPDRVRGFNFDAAICDELAAWQDPAELWMQLQLAVRLRGPKGDNPRIVVATTPKAIPTLKEILADPGTAITRASTFDNAPNLSPAALAALRKRYEGTSIGRQELYGEMLLDVDDALWQRSWIDAARVAEAPPLVRVVIAVDPSVSATGAECGIVAAGKAENGELFVLSDASTRASPEQWARRAAAEYDAHQADALVAEVNQGGALVASVMQSIGFAGKLKTVHAARGKQTRAEPIAALYEQARVHHVGAFPQLEDQLATWVPGEGPSPDRLDALVWAVSELALGRPESEWARQRREHDERMQSDALYRRDYLNRMNVGARIFAR